MKPVFCNGCGAIIPEGLYSLSSEKLWEIGQKFPDDIRRDQILDIPMPAFGKLHFPDKLAFSAASLALKESAGAGGELSGICIAIPYGSLTTDMQFMESVVNNFPSPAYFSATLPSSTIADIAIYHKFKGPNRVICGGDSPVMETFSNAFRLIELGKADTILTLAVWAIEDINRNKLNTSQLQTNASFAFLFSTKQLMQESSQCTMVINDPSARYDSAEEYLFCVELTKMLRKKCKGHTFFTPEKKDNYLSIE